MANCDYPRDHRWLAGVVDVMVAAELALSVFGKVTKLNDSKAVLGLFSSEDELRDCLQPSAAPGLRRWRLETCLQCLGAGRRPSQRILGDAAFDVGAGANHLW